jgi:hypothetical protein
MQYSEFLQSYPIANSYLIKLAAHRIAKTPDFLESEVRARISQINKKLDQVLWEAVPNKKEGVYYLREDLVRFAREHSEEYRWLEQEREGLLSQLVAVKKCPASQPTTAELVAASTQVKDYIQELLLGGTIPALLRWDGVLSNPEKRFLTGTYEFSEIQAKGIGNWRYCDENSYTPAWEPVIETVSVGDNPIGFVTENSYGVKCLNAPSVMFVDIDADSDAEDLPLSCLPFGKFNWNVSMSLEIIHEFCSSNRELLFAVYRTKNGLRLIEMANTWVPDSTEAIGVLSALGSDPLFTSLCRRQGTFRARLEVKPWRQNGSVNQIVCKRLPSIGHARQLSPTAAAIQKVHDAWCLGDGELA